MLNFFLGGETRTGRNMGLQFRGVSKEGRTMSGKIELCELRTNHCFSKKIWANALTYICMYISFSTNK
jgi:hypothetical protein